MGPQNGSVCGQIANHTNVRIAVRNLTKRPGLTRNVVRKTVHACPTQNLMQTISGGYNTQGGKGKSIAQELVSVELLTAGSKWLCGTDLAKKHLEIRGGEGV